MLCWSVAGCGHIVPDDTWYNFPAQVKGLQEVAGRVGGC
jgi:hypothetical protein